MAGIVEKIKDMWNQSGDDYDDDYYDDEEVVEEELEEESTGPSIFKKSNKVVNLNQKTQLKVVVYKPISYGDDTREMASTLMQNHAIVINLEKTKPEESVRILDFLSGVAFSKNGTVKRVATATFIITPSNIEISGEELFDQFEQHGVYF
ncbi:MAG: cell division protein SepF [Clostridia bacterium]